ncbi:MAG: hypothetical protein U1F27_00595 [Turneriella sp.]
MAYLRSGAFFSGVFLIVGLLVRHLHAETVFTETEKFTGKMLRNTDQEVTLKPEKGGEISLSKEKVLAIYDDEGNLIWANPVIQQSDPTPEAKGRRIELPPESGRLNYRGLHLGVAGSAGMLWPNATFSTFPLGTSPDYRPLFEGKAAIAWYTDDKQAFVGSLGYAARRIPVHGINASGVIADGYWPMEYLDVRAGYRLHSDIFFLEAGLLTAIKLANAPLTVETTSRTITNYDYTPRTYLALYFAVGMYLPITQQLYGTATVRVDHAVTPALTGAAPTATGVAGEVISTAPISLVPLSGSLEIGLSWRLPN